MAEKAPAGGGASRGDASKAPVEDTTRRDAFIAREAAIRALWQNERAFEMDAPEDSSEPKFMCTFPYPYMNGRLHLGHAFSLTKAEFSARFNRLMGKNVLFPFGFHCTGMPIQAAANKIKREIDMFGAPPDEAKVAAYREQQVGKSRAKLSKKQQAKQGSAPKLQWEILRLLGFADEDIPAFADPKHWLEYFPPVGKQDLQLFGASVDWRRSFITTSQNPYYDSFIQWQFRYLTREKFVKFGNRPTIYSELDGQICADHDRLSGEGVVPQQYTLIKIQVLDLGKKGLADLPNVVDLEGKKVYLVAATLRPETMYGQTNCFVLPDGEYGVFEINDNEYFICSDRSAKNMSYQGLSKEYAKPVCVLRVTGHDLLGLPLKAPNVTAYERVYCLPLLTISMGKGTGVVTSVPSDAPDDYAALRDLQKKPEFRAKFSIEDHMVEPFEVIPILSVDDEHGTLHIDDFGIQATVKMGDRSAATLCEALDVASQNDTAKLKFIKDRCYKIGFNYGIMTCGKYAGEPVSVAKAKVRADMIAEGLAADYYEPENLVVSRSGDECVVSFEDQWFLDYGEEKWRDSVLAHVNSENFTAFDEKVLKTYNLKLNWLGQWACSRQFGLGTRLPCDPERFVIESLSDSTIYMAYYSVAGLLQGGVLDGSVPGPLGIKPEDMTDEVWDAIFLGGSEIPTDLPVSQANIAKMKREFDYWYPMDLRVSGKDLIGNHLIMSLYNHAAVWRERPELWPRGFFTNGHVLIDGAKMSKAKGTFITVADGAKRYSVDACRYALAVAGDTMDDANFEQPNTNSATKNLAIQEKFFNESFAALKAGELRSGDLSFQDRVFINEVYFLASEARRAYEEMHFKEATKNTFSLMINARKKYVLECDATGVALHEEAVVRFANVFVVTNSPIVPFWAEDMWQKHEVLRRGSSSKLVVHANWPQDHAVDHSLRRNDQFCQKVIKKFKDSLASTLKKKKKLNPADITAEVFIQLEYSDWQIDVLDFLKSALASDPDNFTPRGVTKPLQQHLAAQGIGKKKMGLPLGFASYVVKNEFPANGVAALESKCPIDQVGTLSENAAFIRRTLGVGAVHINVVGQEGCYNAKKEQGMAKPGAPTVKYV